MGDSELLDSLMAVVKAKIGEMITKPKMVEKLLAKPPFRFLHDTITAIITTTGFGDGLYSGAELDSQAITDKQAKLDYLDKIITLVGICKGKPLAVKSQRVVSGLEPENTNQFLIELAECASDTMFDTSEAVRRCLAGEQPGERPPPIRRSGAESKSEPPTMAESKHSGGDNDSKQTSSSSGAKAAPADLDLQQQMAPERGKSRGGTRGGKPNQATADTGLSGGFPSSKAPQLDAEIEKCDGSDAVTQQLLGELISKPKLSEKLLSKPPFRFLHDIVMEVVRTTGFASNLYTATEMDSTLCADKSQKVMFLEKIIKVVGVQLNTLVEAKPAKIVAGLDAPVTNNFLQLLAIAAKHLPDSSNAVRTVLEQLGGDSATDEQPVAKQPESRREAPEVKQSNTVPQQQEERKAEERSKPAARQSQQQAEPKESRPQQQFHSDDQRRDVTDEKPNDDFGGEDGGGEVKRSSRPQSALRRPPKVKEGAKEVLARDLAPVVKKAEGIILDGQGDDDDDDAIPDETRLVDDIKADAKDSGSGNTNDPQSKLVKDIMSRQAEQEAAGRGGAKAVESVEESKTQSADQVNQGAGVRLGVRLGRTNAKATDKKSATGGSATAGTSSSPMGGETDMEKMRASIQTLVQHTGPLGTCMDFIQEDISLMTAELHKWEEECRKYEVEVEESKRRTKESLHPLKVELADVEDQIIEQIAKIAAKKAVISRNDGKISQILKLIATA